MKNPTENRPEPIDEHGECTPETWTDPPSDLPSDRLVVTGWEGSSVADFLDGPRRKPIMDPRPRAHSGSMSDAEPDPRTQEFRDSIEIHNDLAECRIARGREDYRPVSDECRGVALAELGRLLSLAGASDVDPGILDSGLIEIDYRDEVGSWTVEVDADGDLSRFRRG